MSLFLFYFSISFNPCVPISSSIISPLLCLLFPAPPASSSPMPLPIFLFFYPSSSILAPCRSPHLTCNILLQHLLIHLPCLCPSLSPRLPFFFLTPFCSSSISLVLLPPCQMPDLESDSLTTGGPFRVAVVCPVQRGHLAIWDVVFFQNCFTWKNSYTFH